MIYLAVVGMIVAIVMLLILAYHEATEDTPD